MAKVAAIHSGVCTLRDVTYRMLEEVRDLVSDTDFRRARYILDEKERVLAVCAALQDGDYELVGKKMYETHQGLSRDFTVSCDELDYLVDTARECGVTGSRMMGGGFGGCTINLVRDGLCDTFIEKTMKRFEDRFGHRPLKYEVNIGDGSRKL